MNRAQTLGLLRHILTTLGGVLLAQGTMSDTEMTEIVGAIITLVGAGWSFAEKRRASAAAPGPTPGVLGAVIIASVWTAMILAGAVGCATSNTGSGSGESAGSRILTPQRVQAIATLASFIGATADLQAHPERRVAYQTARDGLARLMEQEQWNPEAAAVVLAESGVGAFASDEGAIAITGTLMLTDALGLGDFDARRSDHAVALITGLESGLRRALAAPAGIRSAGPVDDAAALRAAAVATRLHPTL